MILFGLALYYYFIEKPNPNPSFISKFNTNLQIFFVLFVIAGQIFSSNFDLLIQFTGALVFLTSILSGMDYWISWSIKAKQIITAKAWKQVKQIPLPVEISQYMTFESFFVGQNSALIDALMAGASWADALKAGQSACASSGGC